MQRVKVENDSSTQKRIVPSNEIKSLQAKCKDTMQRVKMENDSSTQKRIVPSNEIKSLQAICKDTMQRVKIENDTRILLTNEIKALQAKCTEHCYIIGNNTPSEIKTINSRNCNDKKLTYINSLAKNIQDEETPIISDSNVSTSLFLNEITEKISQVEEITTFTAGALRDVENENNRLRANIKMVQEAKSRPWAGRREVRPEHLQSAQQRFRAMRAELQGLIRSLFPDAADGMIEILGVLMSQRMNEESEGYIHVTPDNYDLIEALKDKNIVSTNPHNNMEVKLAF